MYCKKTWIKALKVKTGAMRDPCTRAHGKLVTPLSRVDIIVLSRACYFHTGNIYDDVSVHECTLVIGDISRLFNFEKSSEKKVRYPKVPTVSAFITVRRIFAIYVEV